jgi:hypothetical protein
MFPEGGDPAGRGPVLVASYQPDQPLGFEGSAMVLHAVPETYGGHRGHFEEIPLKVSQGWIHGSCPLGERSSGHGVRLMRMPWS